ERGRLGLHDEREDVATFAATEAVIEAVLLADVERRRLLGVERAEPDRAGAATPQRHDVGYDLDQVGTFSNRADRVVADAAWHGNQIERRLPVASGRAASTTRVATPRSGRATGEIPMVWPIGDVGAMRSTVASASPSNTEPSARPSPTPATRSMGRRKS